VAKRASKAKLSVPTGLEVVGINCRIPQREVDFTFFASEVEQYPDFTVRRDLKSLAGVIQSDKSIPGVHAHFGLRSAKEKSEFTLEFELIARKHRPATVNGPGMSEFLKLSQRFLRKPSKAYRSLLSINFAFSLAKWQPTITLPFSVSNLGSEFRGNPNIAGVDFTFDLPDSPLELSRAFVTTYEAIDKMVVRLLLWSEVTIGPSLPAHLLGSATELLPIFARERE